MAVNISVLGNCDDAVLFWQTAKRIPDCWGFAIEREKKLDDGKVQRLILDNRMGFKKHKPRRGDHRPSTVWPFQRYWWADHSANNGDTVRYRVTPMVHSDEDEKLQELVTDQSDWTEWLTLSGGKSDGYSSFFNRGLVISQFMARYLEDLRRKEGLETRKDALKAFKDSLSDHELPIRRFLAGELRVRMLELLEWAKKDGRQVFAALYELEDDELVEGLAALKGRAHVVLANGSITKTKSETSAEARKRDQNKRARKALKDAGVEVLPRFVSPGALGHNKFLVVTDKKKSDPKPLLVWTGSTNWTTTGLCTQINNGLVVENSKVAQAYLDHWDLLAAAKNEFTPELVDDNSEVKQVKSGKCKADIWFTRTRKKVDLEAIDEALAEANEAVLFLMFQPGGTGALGTVRKLQKTKKKLYIKGVVSTLPAAAEEDESEVTVDLEGADGSEKRIRANFDVVQPEGIRAPFAAWAATVSRNEFISRQGGVIGFAIVHSKLIVIDPFTNPIVITGSHNFSGSASTKNDENFVIIRGNQELAEHYAAHILSVYQHYRWLAFVKSMQEAGKRLTGFLKERDDWQDSSLKGPAKRELDFWIQADKS